MQQPNQNDFIISDDWEDLYKPDPKELGPFPGITHEEYNNLKPSEIKEFHKYLNQVAQYYHKSIPTYQKEMDDFIRSTTPEQEAMQGSQLQQQENLKNKKQIQQSGEIKKPQFPTAPKFLNQSQFEELYQQFLDFYCPMKLDEYKQFPTPEDLQKRKESEKLQKEQEKLSWQEEKKQIRKQKLENQEEPKEEIINIENLEIDKNIFIEPDESRQPANIVFIGHVDSGKSTLCGRILVDSGEISNEEMKKIEQEARENSREGWWLAYCTDIIEEERKRGKTIECGRAQFQTKTKRFTIFDAPGHSNYVPNMIMGACQADLAGLIISASTGQFESGFQKSGQTQEHALLAKSLGVQHLIVIVTKMDTVNWNKERFDQIKEEISKFLQEKCGFEQIFFIPVNSLNGDNISVPLKQVPWYNGPHLFKLLDEINITARNPKGPIRIPILDKAKDNGLCLFGKIEQGTIVDNLFVSILPKKIQVQIVGIYNSKDQRMKYAKAGENVKIKVKGIEEEDVQRGQMICNLVSNHCPNTTEIQTKIKIIDLPENKRIFSQGYTCILHLHCLVEQVEVTEVLACYENNILINRNFLKSQQEGIVRLKFNTTVCLEKADVLSSLGRFALRDEGKYFKRINQIIRTIAFGEILKIRVKKGQQSLQ